MPTKLAWEVKHRTGSGFLVAPSSCALVSRVFGREPVASAYTASISALTTLILSLILVVIPVTWTKLAAASNDSLTYACCETEASDFSKLFIERIATFGEHLHKHSCVLDTVHFCWRKKKSHAPSLPGDRSFDHETCLCLASVPVASKHTSYKSRYFA